VLAPLVPLAWCGIVVPFRFTLNMLFLASFGGLLDGAGDLVGLAVADADVALAVAGDDERAEAERAAALDDLRAAVDADDGGLDARAVGLPLAARAAAAAARARPPALEPGAAAATTAAAAPKPPPNPPPPLPPPAPYPAPPPPLMFGAMVAGGRGRRDAAAGRLRFLGQVDDRRAGVGLGDGGLLERGGRGRRL
jgi:hypothetical protein